MANRYWVGGAPATLTRRAGNVVRADYLSVQDITVSGGTWYAGANSTNTSGNTGITFSAAPAPAAQMLLVAPLSL